MPSPALRARVRRVAAPSLLASALAFGSTAVATSAHAAEAPQPAAARVASMPSVVPAVKVFGDKAPSTPDKAKSDEEMLAWAVKHGTDADRREIARDLGVAYPSAVSILGATCDKGHGYVGVWVANFSAKTVHWNVTIDGRGYAGAQVLGHSIDTGAIGVPNGKHTIAFVNPSTGAVAARTMTNLACVSTSPVVTKPSHPATSVPTKPSPVKPVPAKPAPAKPAPVKPMPAKPMPAKPMPAKPAPMKPLPAKHVPAQHVPAKSMPATPVHHHAPAKPAVATMGPKVQADFVSAPVGSGVSAPLAALLLSAVGGSLLLARRFMRA